MPPPPQAVRWIAQTLDEAGYATWVVGGAIRDGRLGVAHEDWDLATRARPPQVRRLFRRTVPVGIEHGTVGVLARDGVMYEVTTFRKDVETFGRRAVVEFADRVEDDMARRDFTINAVAWDPLRDTIFDPFGGLEDLEARCLRTVGAPEDRFAEDFLRVLRALRFAGRYDLAIDPPTWHALRDATPHLPSLSAERIREELIKVLTLDPTPSASLELYQRAGALEAVLPELAKLHQTHPETWRQSLAWIDALPRHRVRHRLAVLLASLSPTQVAAILVRLRFSNADTRWIGDVVASLRTGPQSLDPATCRRWLAAVGPDVVPDWMRIRIGACRAGVDDVPPPDHADLLHGWRALRHEIDSGVPLRVGDLALDGRDLIRLGLRPGPEFGRLLDALLARVLTDPTLNDRETLEAMALELAAQAPTREPEGS